MDTAPLKKFARAARRTLLAQVAGRLDAVLVDHSPERRERAEAVRKLEQEITAHGREQVIERAAYTWFNRFCALRFLDVNRYSRIGVVSPVEGQTQPEILAEAKMGHIETAMAPEPVRQRILGLLRGNAPSRDPQGEAYRLLFVAACNFLHGAMPFMFQEIDDYTELLMPLDLLSANSVLAHTRAAMSEEACRDVEVIGWLYQFYISEKKDEVFAGLKKNRKITPENIPAATQLFTPHWIVRYLVENSLGRLWMLNHPRSRLAERMDYYIAPEQEAPDFLRVNSPEEIRICDPACGSGHMLTYAFDLLYAIYEEEGYEPTSIPEQILTRNLYGVEIDQRAGALAAFALTMKARDRHRGFLEARIRPNICVLENIRVADEELNDYMDFIGRDLFTGAVQSTLRQFEEADNFGALIRPEASDVAETLAILKEKDVAGQLLLESTHNRVLQALRYAEHLKPRYHVVIANPPYMGSGGMNMRLSSWIRKNYPLSKSDLFAAFIERGLELVPKFGYSAMVTMQTWMFLSSYRRLRTRLMQNTAIESMAHMANMVMGIAFGTSATVWKVGTNGKTEGAYCYVTYEDLGADNVPTAFPPHNKRNKGAAREGWFYRAGADFKKIPGSPIVYWASQRVLELFRNSSSLSDHIETRMGLVTGSNDLFLRLWHEVGLTSIGFGIRDINEAQVSQKRYFTYLKGGAFRRWSGNFEYVVNWFRDGAELKSLKDPATGRVRSHNYNGAYAFRAGFTWAAISSGNFSVRHVPSGFMFDTQGPMGFAKDVTEKTSLEAFLNSIVAQHLLGMLAPTLYSSLSHLLSLPIVDQVPARIHQICLSAVLLSNLDWNSYETSWDFRFHPLLRPEHRQLTLEDTYWKLHAHWVEMTREMQRLEEENNRIFIDAYGLQDELEPEVPLEEITLTCNPNYRYGGGKSKEELGALLRADTMRELVSYAVGCMFGRYALDKPGLILANQGGTIDDYLMQIPDPLFSADNDNVIPMLDGEWFEDDIAERFRKFLRVAFGEEHYEENLRFVEHSLNVKGRRDYSIRTYFLREFYSDHLRRYRKRPIYWLFSSSRGSFNALIYMHRYRPDTASVVLNEYLREFRAKLEARARELQFVSVNPGASRGDKTRALQEIEKIAKTLVELDAYERETLYPLATRQVAIDLDDGVKANYPKFGKALKKVTGLSAAK